MIRRAREPLFRQRPWSEAEIARHAARVATVEDDADVLCLRGQLIEQAREFEVEDSAEVPFGCVADIHRDDELVVTPGWRILIRRLVVFVERMGAVSRVVDDDSIAARGVVDHGAIGMANPVSRGLLLDALLDVKTSELFREPLHVRYGAGKSPVWTSDEQCTFGHGCLGIGEMRKE